MRSNKTFHTRQLFCDVLITVHRAVVAQALDVSKLRALPESTTSHGRSASVVNLGTRDAALDKRLEDNLRDVNDGQHCLVAVDVMNVYGKPFEVKLERREERECPHETSFASRYDRKRLSLRRVCAENEFYQVRQRIEPGATLR